MLRIVLFCLITIATSLPVLAFQKFEEYRIRGDEIRSVKLGPQEVEDPATLVIELNSDASGVQQITVETDFDVEPCKTSIEEIIGNKQAYIQIVVHVTAQTMNGVVITQCSAMYGLTSE